MNSNDKETAEKIEESVEVNSSFTTFFLLSAIGLSYLLSYCFPAFQMQSGVIILGYALLVYFVWDFIKQLYSPGQSVILYFITFVMLPAAMSIAITDIFPMTGIVIWMGAQLVAGIFELLYELILKPTIPKGILRRLMIVDNKIDRSLLSIHKKQLSYFNLTGFLVALFFIVGYAGVVLLLVVL